MALDERLELDITEALRGIDSIESALSGAASSFKVALAEALDVLGTVVIGDVDAGSVTAAIDSAVAAADAQPVIDADASAITDQVDSAVAAADAVVTPEADTTAMVNEIDDAASAADAVVPVEADTTAAENEIADLGDAASSATGPTTDLGGAVTALSAGAALGRGELGGLSEGAAGLGGNFATAATGVAAVALTLGEFFTKAVDSESAERRLLSATGEFADEVKRVDVGGLNEELSTLAERTGQDDEALKRAAARFFDLGRNAGVAGPEVAKSTKQLEAISIALATANPALGQAGTVADRLTTGFARGGRALAPFGIALSAAEINARALGDTGKNTAADLTIFEKAQAGLNITLERTPNLTSKIADGLKNPQIQLQVLQEKFKNFVEAIGVPLISPILEGLSAVQPDLEQLAGLLARLGAEALPLVLKALEAAQPILGVFGGGISLALEVLGPLVDLITSIPTPALTAAAGVLLVAKAIDAITLAIGTVEAVGGIAALVEGGAAAFFALLSPLGIAVITIGALVAVLSQGSDAEDAHASAVDRATKAYGDNTKSVQENTAALAAQDFAKQASELNRVGLTIEQVTRLASQGRSGYREFLDQLSATGRITPAVANALANSKDNLTDFAIENQVFLDTQKGVSRSTFDLIGAFQQFAGTSQEGARAQLALAQAHGQVTSEQLRSAEAQHRLSDGTVDYVGVLGQLVPKQAGAAAGARDAANATDDQTVATDALGRALKDVLAAEEEQIQKELGLVSASLGAESSARSTEKAQRDLATAIRDHGAASDEAKDADLRLRQAQETQVESLVRLAAQNRDTAVAQLENSGITVDAAVKSQLYRDELVRLAGTVADPMRTQILGLADDIRSIPPTSNTTINVDAVKALDDINATHVALDILPEEKRIAIAIQVFGAEHAQAVIDGIKADTGNIDPRGHMAGLAAGPVAAGEPVVVGEGGHSEVWWPDTSGWVINQPQWEQLGRQLGLGGSPSRTSIDNRQYNLAVSEVTGDPVATANTVAFRLGEDAHR